MSNRGESGMMDNITSDFSSSSEAGLSSGGFGLKEFMESNSYVAKFAFVLMVLIVFYILMKVVVIVLSYFMLPSLSPYVLDGTASGDSLPIYVPQDPALSDSIFISRSMNENGGLEYTWSAWFLINTPPSTVDKYSRIFSKGGEGSKHSVTGIYYPNNAPGLYIKVTEDVKINDSDRKDTGKNITLIAVVDVNGKQASGATASIDNMNEQLVATDIPMKKWVNAIIRVTNNVIDLYINGRLVQRKKTIGIPVQNYGKINIGETKPADKFNGFISTIQYFNYSIGANKISSIVDEGPVLKMVGGEGAENAAADSAGTYLSNNWFLR